MMTYQEFAEQFAKIKQTYRRQVDFSKEYARYLPGDLIEIHSDLQRVFPVLQQIVNCEVPPQEFWRNMNQVEAHIWHLVDHLSDLRTTLEKLWEDELAELAQKQKKRAAKRKKSPKKASKNRREKSE